MTGDRTHVRKQNALWWEVAYSAVVAKEIRFCRELEWDDGNQYKMVCECVCVCVTHLTKALGMSSTRQYILIWIMINELTASCVISHETRKDQR